MSDQDSRGSGPLDLSLLRTFLAVHRLGSFTAAARRLGLSQSTVTTQIRALENHLGRELFAGPVAGRCTPNSSPTRSSWSPPPAWAERLKGKELPTALDGLP